MSKAVAIGHGFFKEIAGLGHTADAWTQPFLLTSRWWNGNKNAWDIMASTHKGKTGTTAARAVTTNASGLDLQDAAAAEAAVQIFPNPVRDAFTLNLNNPYTGKMLIQVMDVSGAIRKEYATDKNQPVSQVMVNISGLATGTYFVRITVGNWQTTRKIVKI
jgi:endoglucanase